MLFKFFFAFKIVNRRCARGVSLDGTLATSLKFPMHLSYHAPHMPAVYVIHSMHLHTRFCAILTNRSQGITRLIIIRNAV